MVVPIVTRAGRLALRAAGALAFLPALLTRLVVGYTFYQTGGGKLAHFENTVAFFTDLGIPLPELNAAFVARLEYWGGLALVLGLLTRGTAAGLLATMTVALLTADRANLVTALTGSGEIGPTDVPPLVLGLFLLWLVLHGPGLLSVDTWLARALGIEERTPPAAPAPAESPAPNAA